MGPALDSLQGITQLVERTPAALVLIGVLGAIALVMSAVINVIPLIGWIVGIPLFVLDWGLPTPLQHERSKLTSHLLLSRAT